MQDLQEQITSNKCLPLDDPAMSSACQRATFDLATCLCFNRLDPASGLQLYRTLTELGHSEAMVGVGVVLIEGIEVEGKEETAAVEEGLKMLRHSRAPTLAVA